MKLNFKIDHIHLYCAEIEATAQWYCKMLDAQLVRSRQSDGRVRTDLIVGGLTIYLGDAKKLQGSLGWKLNDATPSPRFGLDHFGLFVDDVETAAAELRLRGANITYGPKTLRPGASCFFIEAPDGVTIEVVNRNLAIDGISVEP
jgi:lactoylglutathione lyase